MGNIRCCGLFQSKNHEIIFAEYLRWKHTFFFKTWSSNSLDKCLKH